MIYATSDKFGPGTETVPADSVDTFASALQIVCSPSEEVCTSPPIPDAGNRRSRKRSLFDHHYHHQTKSQIT